MKKYIIPIFLASLLLLSACSPQLKESDFILTNEDLCGGAYIKYRELFHSYFTIKDYGGGYMEDGKFVYCLNEDSKQKENIDRFFELANAELEKKGWEKIKTVMVKHSIQELKDAQKSIDDGFERGEFRFFSIGISATQRKGENSNFSVWDHLYEKTVWRSNIPTYRNLIRRRC